MLGGEGEEWGKFGTGGRVEGWLGDGGWNRRKKWLTMAVLNF